MAASWFPCRTDLFEAPWTAASAPPTRPRTRVAVPAGVAGTMFLSTLRAPGLGQHALRAARGAGRLPAGPGRVPQRYGTIRKRLRGGRVLASQLRRGNALGPIRPGCQGWKIPQTPRVSRTGCWGAWGRARSTTWAFAERSGSSDANARGPVLPLNALSPAGRRVVRDRNRRARLRRRRAGGRAWEQS
jgi:hypothetical protein